MIRFHRAISRLSAVRQSHVVRSICVLAGGNALAHSITILSIPISTRLFSPADYAVAATFSSIVGIIVVASCLRYDMAIALPESDAEAVNVLALSVGSLVGVTALVALIVAALPDRAFMLLGQPVLLSYLWMIPAAIFLGGLYAALQMWFVRRKAFGAIAASRVSQSAMAASGELGLGWAGFAPLGLMVGRMLNHGVGAMTLGARFIWRERALLRHVSVQAMTRAARAYHRFPRYSVMEALSNAAAIHAPILLIAAMAIGPEAGYAALAIYLLQAPMALLGTAMGQVYLSEAPAALREGRLGRHTVDSIARLMLVGVSLLTLAAIVSPSAFEWVFGQGWARAGTLVAWMTPWFILQFISSPVSSALHVIGRQRLALVLQVSGLVFRTGIVFAVGLLWPQWIVEAYAVTGAIFYLVYLAVVCRAVEAPLSGLTAAARRAAPWVALAAAIGCVAVATLYWIGGMG